MRIGGGEMVQSDRDVDKAQKQLLDFGYVEWGADDRGPVLDPSKPFMGMSERAYKLSTEHWPTPSHSYAKDK